MPTQVPAGTLTFSVADWTGPAGVSLLQGAKWAGRDFFVYQADRLSGREDLIIRRYDSQRKYKGYLTVVRGGHGSSTGVIQVNETTSRHLIPAGDRGILAVDYIIGNAGTPPRKIFNTVGYCSAVSCNNSANRLSVRKGGSSQTITWYNRDKILAGEKPQDDFRFSFPTPKNATFQGHYNFGDSDYFHWETEGIKRGTKGYRSWAERWTNGKKVATLDTTPWFRTGEPQGFLGYNNALYFCKRVGGLNRQRFMAAIPCRL